MVMPFVTQSGPCPPLAQRVRQPRVRRAAHQSRAVLAVAVPHGNVPRPAVDDVHLPGHGPGRLPSRPWYWCRWCS
ncbi:hypothetical protein QJS66_01900 [Kocuria rhizophila]|nr:hypothetical protein QJS66_01900 [Kocuria rhizophila]